LQLVVDLYPESAGALLNLASAQEQIKKFDHAKTNYKKIIDIEPDSSAARTAKEKLKYLNKQ